MKAWKCDCCSDEIDVLDDYEPINCCDGRECGCHGLPMHPAFCDLCWQNYLDYVERA